MKAYQITIGLLCMLIAFLIASWGRFLEWWNDLSPGWKTGAFLFVWALLIFIGYRHGQEWVLAAVVAGPVAIVLIAFFYADKFLDELEK